MDDVQKINLRTESENNIAIVWQSGDQTEDLGRPHTNSSKEKLIGRTKDGVWTVDG